MGLEIIVLIVLVLLGLCGWYHKFVRGWWLTFWYSTAIMMKGFRIAEEAEYRAMAKSLTKQWGEAVIALYDITVEAEGLDNIPPSDTPSLFLCNHQSRCGSPIRSPHL